MQQLMWLKLHIGSMEQGIELIDQFYWYISVHKTGDAWIVKGGEKVLLRTDNKDSIDAFLYGMALAYSILPEPMIKQFQEDYNPL